MLDGHSGTECSSVLDNYLSAYVAKEISNLSKLVSKEERIKDVSSAIEKAFIRLDNDLLEGRILTVDMPSSWFSWWSNAKVDTSLILKNLRNAMYGNFTFYEKGQDHVHSWRIWKDLNSILHVLEIQELYWEEEGWMGRFMLWNYQQIKLQKIHVNTVV